MKNDFDKRWARMEAQHNKTVRRGILGFVLAMIAYVVISLSMLGGAVWVVIWVLREMGVIS